MPEELKARVDEYNKANPCKKINISQVAQAAIYEKLIEVTAKA